MEGGIGDGGSRSEAGAEERCECLFCPRGCFALKIVTTDPFGL